jgi:hypothetical protein
MIQKHLTSRLIGGHDHSDIAYGNYTQSTPDAQLRRPVSDP